MNARICAAAQCFILWFVWPGIGLAQQNWIEITTVRLKPGMIDAWRDMYKKDIIPAYRKAGISSLAVWKNGPFGPAYEFTVITPIRSFAEFDNQRPLLSGMGQKERDAIARTLGKCILEMRSTVMLAQADTSVAKSGAAPPPLIMFQTVTVSPRNAAGYIAFLRDEIKPAISAAGVDVWMVYQSVFGSDGNQITTIRSVKNYAELDAGPLAVRIMGSERALSAAAKSDQLIESSRIILLEYDSEISYGRIF